MGEAWMPLLRWSWEGRECDGLWEYGKHCQPQMSSPRASRDLVLGAPSMTLLCKRGGDTAWGAEGPQFCGLLLPSQLLPVSAVVTGCLIKDCVRRAGRRAGALSGLSSAEAASAEQ